MTAFAKKLLKMESLDMTLNEFIRSDGYMAYLDVLDVSLPMRMERKQAVHQVVIDLISEWMGHAPASAQDLGWLIDEHGPATMRYVAAKLEKYTVPDGGVDGIVNLPPTVVTPIGHLIEFLIMVKMPEKLGAYLKAARMPNAGRYGREISAIFEEARVPLRCPR